MGADHDESLDGRFRAFPGGLFRLTRGVAATEQPWRVEACRLARIPAPSAASGPASPGSLTLRRTEIRSCQGNLKAYDRQLLMVGFCAPQSLRPTPGGRDNDAR